MSKYETAPTCDTQFFKTLANEKSLYTDLLAFAHQQHDYHPWRYIKYHTPKALPPKDAWRMLTFVRQARPVHTLTNTAGHPFVLAHPDILKRKVDEAYQLLNNAFTSTTSLQNLNEDHRRAYIQRTLEEEAISSSQFEGAITTRKVAREMLRTQRPPRDNSERMIANNYTTMGRLQEWKKHPLSLEMLKEIQAQLTEDLLDETQRGHFRTEDDIYVYDGHRNEIVHVPPLAKDLETRLQKIVDFANADDTNGSYYYAIEKAAILHFMIGYEHPFADGNGRTARAVFYWFLMRKGWWLIEFISISSLLKQPLWRKRYEEAYMDVETCGSDLTYFVLQQLDCLIDAAKKFHRKIETLQHQIDALSSALGHLFNPRQIALWQHCQRHTNYTYTAHEHAAWHNISLNTARSDLEGLRTNGFLTLQMRGKTRTYKPLQEIKPRRN